MNTNVGKHSMALAIRISAVIATILAPSLSNAQQRQTNFVHTCAPAGKISAEGFQALMRTIAKSWNRGDARLAASCFADDAVYSGPPSLGHHGRKALYEFFGGAKGRKLPMSMTWHHLVFDPDHQIGVGEYTFRERIQTHGMVIVRISSGLIRNWREYEVESSLPWDQFVGDNRF
jgi:hypothetical protein